MVEILRNWGFSVKSAVSLICRDIDVSSATRDMLEVFVDWCFKNNSHEGAYDEMKRLFGLDIAAKHVSSVMTSFLCGFPLKRNSTIVKAILVKTGDEIVLVVQGNVDKGDQVIQVGMHDEFGRSLGIIISNEVRKGVCCYTNSLVPDDLGANFPCNLYLS